MRKNILYERQKYLLYGTNILATHLWCVHPVGTGWCVADCRSLLPLSVKRPSGSRNSVILKADPRPTQRRDRSRSLMVWPVTQVSTLDSSGFTSGLMGRSVYELTRTERTHWPRVARVLGGWGWGGVLRPAYGMTWSGSRRPAFYEVGKFLGNVKVLSEVKGESTNDANHKIL